MKIQNGISLVPPTAEERLAKQDEALKQASKMYEKHFLNEMVKAMRSTVGQEDGLIKKNMAEKIFAEQLDQKYVDGWSDKGGVGLADLIYTQVKEKYFANKQQGMKTLPHALPIAPKRDLNGLGSPESIQMKMIPPPVGGGGLSYRFEVPNSLAGDFEVQTPMPGKLTEIKNLDQGWSTVRLDHGQGMISELTFPGQVTNTGIGNAMEAGQKLGILDSKRPVVAWNLDWT